MKERKKSWDSWVRSLVESVFLPLKARKWRKAPSNIGISFLIRVADLLMYLCAYLSGRWNLRKMAVWSSTEAPGRSQELSPLFGRPNSLGSSRYCGKWPWIFCQMPPEREEWRHCSGKRLWDEHPRTEAKISIGRCESPQAALLQKVWCPRACFGEQRGSSCAWFFCSSPESFVSSISSFNVTALG